MRIPFGVGCQDQAWSTRVQNGMRNAVMRCSDATGTTTGGRATKQNNQAHDETSHRPRAGVEFQKKEEKRGKQKNTEKSGRWENNPTGARKSAEFEHSTLIRKREVHCKRAWPIRLEETDRGVFFVSCIDFHLTATEPEERSEKRKQERLKDTSTDSSQAQGVDYRRVNTHA